MPPKYDVHLGPLAFVCYAAGLGESIGDALDVVGAAIAPGEPKPNPLKLSLPIRGDSGELDPKAAGYRLRRQVRQLLENRRWRSEVHLLQAAFDLESDVWVRFGGGDITEEDPSIVLGDWTLELTDVYAVARPGTHRPARRLELGDRRGGLVALDTRGLLYSTDHAAQPLPPRPLIIPGDVKSVTMTRNRPPTTNRRGRSAGGRLLFRALAAADGDVASFVPDTTVLTDPAAAYRDLALAGAVKVWDTTASTVAIDGTAWTTANSLDPTAIGWERVYGKPNGPATRLAIENGVCRLVWLGPATTQGLAVEYWDGTLNRYVRIGRVAGATNVDQITVVELTAERAVVEFRGAELSLRAILQRGWSGPRLEGYNDAAAGAGRLEYVPDDLNAVAPTAAALAIAWADRIRTGLATNLVTNPSFELDAAGWSTAAGLVNAGATIASVADATAPVGTRVGEIVGNGASVNEGAFHLLNLTAGTTYTGRVRLKRTAGASTISAYVVRNSAPFTVYPIATNVTPAAFTEYVANLTPNFTGQHALVVQINTATATTVRVDTAQVADGAGRPYFDGDIAGRWTGTPHASTSEGPGILTNLVTNPSFEVDTAGWIVTGNVFLAGGHATIARVADAEGPGSFVAEIVTDGTTDSGAAFATLSLAAGVTYRIRVRFKRTAGTTPSKIAIGRNTAPFTETVLAAAAADSVLTEYTALFTPAVTDTYTLYCRQTAGGASTYRIDAVLVTAGDSEYFDGDSVAGEWAGTAHASRSRKLLAADWVKGTDADARSAAGTYLTGASGFAYTLAGKNVVVAQLGLPGSDLTVSELASRALADTRNVPTLIAR